MEVTETTNELVKVVETSGVEPQTATTLKESFLPFFEQAEEWKRKAEALVVTDATQVHDMKMARTARLALKEIRVNADKKRKELKEDSLRYGKAVQGVYNVIEFLIAPIEKHLQEQEDFVAIAEAKRKAELKASREMEIQPFAEFVALGLNFGEMTDEDYAKTLNGAKLQLQAKIEAEQKSEAEKIAKEKAEAEERERIRIENERLKAEAEAKERQLAEERAKAEAERKAIEEKARKEKEEAEKKAQVERAKAEAERKAIEEKARKEKEEAEKKAQVERAKQDAILKAEREAKEKLEAELKAKAEAEQKARKEAEEKAAAELKAKQDAEKKAKAAPDKAKLNDFAKMLDELTLPELKSEEANKVLSDAKTLLQKVSTFIREKSSII
jgi:colicin import membrane protein